MPQAIPAVVAAAQSAYAAYAGLNIVAQIGIQLAAGAALTAASTAFQQVPRTPALKRELARPNSLPPYRYVYGRNRVYGSPAPFRVRGNRLYGCLILNSRPSLGGLIQVAVDKRPITPSGDPLNFAGPGAVATTGRLADHFRYWIGLGDQLGPPAQILAEVPDIFQASDAWRGRTVIWVKCNSGSSKEAAKRWRRVPPEIEVEMDWSRVWDPRDPAQSWNDQTTWAHSNNAVLITLDALMRNPVAPYRLRHIDLQTWVDAADIADQPVPLLGGGTEARYRASGLIDWSSGEIEQLIEPLILASAGGVTRIGGRLAAIPGAWQEPEVTITDILGDEEIVVEAQSAAGDVYTGVRTTYINTARDWKPADAGVYRVAGAQEADGGIEKIRTVDLSWVTSPTQAQRIGKILALEGRQQRQVSGVFPPHAFQAVPGGIVTLALPGPMARINGLYRVETIHPAFALAPEAGVHLRCPAVLRASSAAIYAWDPAVDQRPVLEVVGVDGEAPTLEMPGAITAVSGSAAALGSGGTAQPRIRFAFAPAASDRVRRYEVQYRIVGGSWQDGGSIDADVRDGSGQVFGYVYPVQIGQTYQVQVRSEAADEVSLWRTSGDVVALAADVVLTPPTGGSATGSAGMITIRYRLPNSDDVRGIQIWVNTVNDSATAAILGPNTVWAGPNTEPAIEHTSLPAGARRYYWARTVGPYGATSTFSAGVTAVAA